MRRERLAPVSCAAAQAAGCSIHWFGALQGDRGQFSAMLQLRPSTAALHLSLQHCPSLRQGGGQGRTSGSNDLRLSLHSAFSSLPCCLVQALWRVGV